MIYIQFPCIWMIDSLVDSRSFVTRTVILLPVTNYFSSPNGTTVCRWHNFNGTVSEYGSIQYKCLASVIAFSPLWPSTRAILEVA